PIKSSGAPWGGHCSSRDPRLGKRESMPRDIPVGNGQMLVTFDHHYQIRDLYYPHVGQDNHAGGGPCRFGVYAPLAVTGKGERRKARVYWSDDRWDITRRYHDDTLATDVTLRHDDL